jgi:hypothetical protein
MLRKARAHAEVCSQPAPARVNVSPAFRYGCFCGAGHPGFADASGRPPAQLDRRQREKLVARYYAVKPVDAIDAACQAHDVCWIWNGRRTVACNDAFADAMRRLRAAFKEDEKPRCATLALDMQRAAEYVLPSVSWHDRAEKLLLSPVTAVEVLRVGASAFRDSYPHPDERCDYEKSGSDEGTRSSASSTFQ